MFCFLLYRSTAEKMVTMKRVRSIYFSPEKVICSSFSSHNDVDKFLTLQFYRKLFTLMRHISHTISDVLEYDIPAL